MTEPATFRQRYQASLPPYHCDGCDNETDSIIVVDGRDLCPCCYTRWKDERAVDDEFDLLEVYNDARGG